MSKNEDDDEEEEEVDDEERDSVRDDEDQVSEEGSEGEGFKMDEGEVWAQCDVCGTDRAAVERFEQDGRCPNPECSSEHGVCPKCSSWRRSSRK